MKKFILRCLIFIACVLVMDYSLGLGFSWLRSHAKGGSTANCEYIANRSTDDIIILGSSRATHHYIPQIIEDSLGVSCYNCGEEGNGVVLAYGRLQMLTERYVPKLVIYEITPKYDYGTTEPNSKYLGYLRAYYGKEGINEIISCFDDNLSKLRMQSKMYQNTSRILPDLVDNLIFRDNHDGYEPLYGQMNDDFIVETNDIVSAVDSMKLALLEKLIVLCKDKEIPLLFMISPYYKNEVNIDPFEPAFRLCGKYGIEVGNFMDDPGISQRVDYFQDPDHLNQKGATAYTQRIIPLIKSYIQ